MTVGGDGRGGRPRYRPRLARDPRGGVAPRYRRPVRVGREATGERPDDRRRRMGRRPDRRYRHGEHRAHVPWRRRALASRRRAPSVRARRRRWVRAVRRPSGWDEQRHCAVRVATADRRPARRGGGACRSVAGPITRCSRARGRPSNQRSSAFGSSASSCRRSSAATSSGARCPSVSSSGGSRTRGPSRSRSGSWRLRPTHPVVPITVAGARPTARGPAPTAHRSMASVFGEPGRSDAPTALQGTLALAARADDGWDLSARAAFDPVADTDLWSDFATDGRLDAALAGPRRIPHGRAGGCRAGGDDGPRTRRATAVRFALAWDLPMVEFGAGRRWWKRYTRDWGRSGGRAWDLAVHALERGARVAGGDRGLAATDPGRPGAAGLVSGGTLQRAVLPGRRRDVLGGRRGRRPEPEPDDVGRFALLECVDYPFYDTVDVDFYASFAILELFPSWSCAGSATCLRHPCGRPDVSSPSRPPVVKAPRKVGGAVPHDVGGPDDDPFHRPNWYRFQDVNGWKDLGPKFVLQAWRDAVAVGRHGRCPHPRCVPDRRRRAAPAVGRRS